MTMTQTKISAAEVWRNEDDRPLIVACASRLDGKVYVATAPACFSRDGAGRATVNPRVAYTPPGAIVNNVERWPSTDYGDIIGLDVLHVSMREFVARFGGTLTEQRPR